MIGENLRGGIIENILIKIIWINNKLKELGINEQITIIGLTATLNNIISISNWLDAEYYISDYRPIPLQL